MISIILFPFNIDRPQNECADSTEAVENRYRAAGTKRCRGNVRISKMYPLVI